MSDLTSRITLTSSANTAGFAAIQAEAGRTSGILEKLKLGLGTAAGIGGFQAISSGLHELVTRGLSFNETIETATTSVASLLRNFQGDKFTTFDAAMTASSSAIASLRKEAETSPFDFKTLLTALTATSGAAFAANIPLEKQIGLLNKISKAASVLGVPSEELAHNARALFTGHRLEESKLAAGLQIKGEDIAAAKTSAEGLFGFLERRLSSISDSASHATGNFAVLKTNLSQALDEASGRLTAQLFDQLKNSAGDLTTALNSLKAEDIKPFAESLAAAAKAAAHLLEFTLKNASAIRDLVLGYAALRLAVPLASGAIAAGRFAQNFSAAAAGAPLSQQYGLARDLAFPGLSAMDRGARDAAGSLGKFSVGLGSTIPLLTSLLAGYSAGAALDDAFNISGKIANAINGPTDTPPPNRANADEDRLTSLRVSLTGAVGAGDAQAFEFAAVALRKLDAELSRFKNDDTFAAVATSTAHLTDKLEGLRAVLDANAAHAADVFRTSLRTTVRAAEATPLTLAQDKARETLAAQGFGSDALSTDIKGHLDARVANLKGFLDTASTSPDIVSTPLGKEAAGKAQAQLAALAPQQAALKKATDADPLTLARKTLAETLAVANESERDTLTRHIRERASDRVSPDELTRLKAQNANALDEASLKKLDTKDAPKELNPATLLADSATRIGGFQGGARASDIATTTNPIVTEQKTTNTQLRQTHDLLSARLATTTTAAFA